MWPLGLLFTFPPSPLKLPPDPNFFWGRISYRYHSLNINWNRFNCWSPAWFLSDTESGYRHTFFIKMQMWIQARSHPARTLLKMSERKRRKKVRSSRGNDCRSSGNISNVSKIQPWRSQTEPSTLFKLHVYPFFHLHKFLKFLISRSFKVLCQPGPQRGTALDPLGT